MKTRAEILGENLKRLRQEKGVSRKLLAERLGFSIVAVGEYENGKKQPPLEKIFAIADYLKVSVASLTGENDYSDKLPNIKKLIEENNFEYRYQQALKKLNSIGGDLTETQGIFQLSILINRPIKNEKNIIVTEPVWCSFYIQDEKTFVDFIEYVENRAIRFDLVFSDVLKECIEDNIKLLEKN